MPVDHIRQGLTKKDLKVLISIRVPVVIYSTEKRE